MAKCAICEKGAHFGTAIFDSNLTSLITGVILLEIWQS